MATVERGSARRGALRQSLVEAQAALSAVLDRVGPEEWARPSPNAGWSVRELLAHLSSAERGFLPVLRRIADGAGGVPDDFDPNRWNAGQLRRTGEASVDELRARLDAAHAEMLELLDELDEAAFGQRGRLSSGGEGSLEDAFKLVARHKRGHTAQIEAALAGGAAGADARATVPPAPG